ncbi:MAG: polyprenyl synthetase family protein [Lactobacillales bacterium]|nr:polyprenyl synthetase family protein [Lactobacillales bacterium]
MELNQIWQPYPELSNELKQTVQLMENSLKLKNKDVEKAILEMIHNGGKLLRPAYQLLFSNFGANKDEKKRLALAASIEMLHTATLIHDDVVDHALTRRGTASIAHRFGSDVAVYAGDYLFVTCFKLMADFASSMRSLQFNSNSMERILNGELGQMNDRYNLDETVDQYIENISGKTAELFGMSCFVGAFESGCTERFSKNVGEIGQHIGLAFQMIDDLLDYTQSAENFGKPVLQDMVQGVYSLPLLYALQEKREELVPILLKKEQMTETDIATIVEKVYQTKAIEKTQKLAESYTVKALNGLKKLPDDEKNTRELLIELTEKILERKS